MRGWRPLRGPCHLWAVHLGPLSHMPSLQLVPPPSARTPHADSLTFSSEVGSGGSRLPWGGSPQISTGAPRDGDGEGGGLWRRGHRAQQEALPVGWDLAPPGEGPPQTPTRARTERELASAGEEVRGALTGLGYSGSSRGSSGHEGREGCDPGPGPPQQNQVPLPPGFAGTGHPGGLLGWAGPR